MGTVTAESAGLGANVHGDLLGLAADDHAQYLLLANRAGGQVIGSTGVDRILSIEDSGATERVRVGEDTSALFELISTSQGFGLPRMTTAERDAIAAPQAGLLIWNTTTGETNQYNGAIWELPGGEVTSLTLTGLFNTILNVFQNKGASPLSVDLAPVVNLVGLNTAYLNVPTIPISAVPVTMSNDGTSATNLTFADTFTPPGALIGGGILSNGVVTYTNAVFIWALLQESKTYRAGVNPGFAAFTLFNALPVIENSGNFNLVSALVLNVGVNHRRNSSGTSTVATVTGLAFSPQSNTTVSGAVLTKTAMTAVQVSPTYNTVAGSTVNLGTITGLQCNQPAVALFGSAAGVENMAAYYGLNFNVMPFGGNVPKVVVRSALAPASNAYFLQNNGGAQSDLGNGSLLNVGVLDHNGATLGFYGSAPVAKSAAYTPSNVVADRAYDANSTTLDEVADVLGTLIADLQAVGLIG